jgi:hypothetical protein
MSFWDYLFNFDSDGAQRSDLLRHDDELQYLENRIETQSDKLAVKIDKLEKISRENAELKLVCRTLVQILIDRDIITQEGFIQLARQLEHEYHQQNGQDEAPIIPQPEPEPEPSGEIEIDFSSARQKPESFNI